MSDPTLRLSRLLNHHTAAYLLQQFTDIFPDVSIVLLSPEGRVFAVGHSALAEQRDDVLNAQLIQNPTLLPLQVAGEAVGVLRAEGAGLQRPEVKKSLCIIQHSLELLLQTGLDSRALAQETLDRYREINLLYKMSETIGVSLNPDEIPHLVLAEATKVIYADVGGVFLRDPSGHLVLKAGYGTSETLKFLREVAPTMLVDVLAEGHPSILTAEQLRQDTTKISMVLCIPMLVHSHLLGLVVLGRLSGQSIFTASDQKLLLALSGQAAVAIENARLFANVKQQRDAIAEMKHEMDNIFASIGSGIITLDAQDAITIVNPAAERILGVSASEILGHFYVDALPELGQQIAMLVNIVKHRDEPILGYEMQPLLPERGRTNLRLHLNPLKDNDNHTTGIAIVLDDLTQQKQLEAFVKLVRGTFERYVSSQVVEQLLSDPEQIRLGGVRREVTILFADIRGFTAFSEKVEPEPLVELLNQHLTLLAEAILDEEGTLDKFMGDAVMAIFNAPLPQPDHTMRAVRAALKMQEAVRALHAKLSPEKRLGFGVGIVTGPAVVGNVGSPVLQNYTAIGDSVNLASRLQRYAAAGQILLDANAYEHISDCVDVRELGLISFKGHSEPDLVFEVLDLCS